MKFFISYFHEPWKVYKDMNMDSSWVMKVTYILDRYISWPLKRQLQPSMYFMGDESSNGHEIPMKGQLKTHESVQLTLAQK